MPKLQLCFHGGALYRTNNSTGKKIELRNITHSAYSKPVRKSVNGDLKIVKNSDYNRNVSTLDIPQKKENKKINKVAYEALMKSLS